MDYLFVSNTELDALGELPYIQRVAYLMGIRPYMDRESMVVGIKRKISYQSLREILYVAPIAGVQTGSPSKEQVRRAIKGLERAGLIEIQSTDKQLIFKCLLADRDNYISNKADTRPTYQADTRPTQQKPHLSSKKEIKHTQADRDKTLQADIPHNSENNYLFFLGQQFEKFWAIYPQPKNKAKAWEEFQKLAPDELLFNKIIEALKNQIAYHQAQLAKGEWVPYWKYPNNWLAEKTWEEVIDLTKEQECSNAKRQRNHTKKSPAEIMWESCKEGAKYFDFDFEDDEEGGKPTENVIQLSAKR